MSDPLFSDPEGEKYDWSCLSQVTTLPNQSAMATEYKYGCQGWGHWFMVWVDLPKSGSCHVCLSPNNELFRVKDHVLFWGGGAAIGELSSPTRD